MELVIVTSGPKIKINLRKLFLNHSLMKLKMTKKWTLKTKTNKNPSFSPISSLC